MPLDPKYLGAIKGYEGYTPRATWDYRQNSNGYGTKAKYAGEVIDKDEAERRFQYEIALARDQVRALGIPMSPGQEAALTSLTYNAGSGWINSGLGAAVKSGDWDDAAKRFVQYNKAGGETLPGLVNRRSGEASWLTDATPVSQDAEAQAGGFYGQSTPASDTAVASLSSASVSKDHAKSSWAGDLASFGKSAETAMRLARGAQQPEINHDSIQFVAPAPMRPTKMAEAPVPYTTRAEGGAIDDTGSNIPEDVNALRAQQRQLIEGRRSAQMFPHGTEELPLPPFMERIETARGVYHFDPMKVSADEIMEASRTGRENDILGLGPLSENDVAKLMGETGESPVAITERDHAGNEVKASMATPSTVAMQSDEILRSAAPGHEVDVEPVGDVVMARGIGAGVESYARGGGIGSSMPIVGPLTGATGGRADKIPGTARSGSHVIPADTVAHLGQGNSMAGLRTLQKMFKTGPYGTPLPTRRRADGGEVESEIPVMLSDGEFVVPPEMVAELGGGDIAMGHDVLDAWIMDERQKAIQTLSELPPPATD